MTNILIGITTFRRPGLLRQALNSIEKLRTDAQLRVLVADNDAQGREGFEIVEQMREQGYRFPLSAIIVADRGFTYGRNALIEAGFSEPSTQFVVIMDDDQQPDPDWLENMLKIQKTANVDVIGPAVWPTFERPASRWVRESRIYRRDTVTSGLVDLLYGDGGTMISRRLLKLLPSPWYDHRFALTGGADSELYLRLRKAGARFARAHDAIIYEFYPASRMTLRWALSRAYRLGNTDMLIALMHRRTVQVFAREAVLIPGALAVSPFLLLLNIGRPGRQVDALCKIARACGKVAALFGSQYKEYATIHGH